MRFAGIFLVLFGLIFAGVGGAMAWRQERKIATFMRVDADIVEAHTEVRTDSENNDTLLPVATFRYTVNRSNYEGHKVFPEDVSSSTNWANKVVERVRAMGAEAAKNGTHVAAYVNPRDPGDAFLIPEYTWFPYPFLIAGLATLSVGIALLSGMAGRRWQPRAVAVDGSGWQLVMPRDGRREFAAWAFWAGTALIALGLPLGHWMLVAGQRGIFAMIVGMLLVAGLAIPGWAMLRRWSGSRFLSPARVRMKPWPIVRGEVAEVEIEADARRPMNIKQITAKFICTEHYREKSGGETTQGTRKRLERVVPLAQAARIREGDTLQGKGSFLCSKEEAPPSCAMEGKKEYPYYTWEMRLEMGIEHAPHYRATFPLAVV